MFETKFSTEITEPKKNEQRTKAKIKSNENLLDRTECILRSESFKKAQHYFRSSIDQSIIKNKCKINFRLKSEHK